MALKVSARHVRNAVHERHLSLRCYVERPYATSAPSGSNMTRSELNLRLELEKARTLRRFKRTLAAVLAVCGGLLLLSLS
ncbi:MAG: hypothetical protein IPJ76_18695 [Flavobacteriales bacterium]|nr:MAG: hypothetical protein IPJ76_18695 [Flavobacteriales bacterium]